MKRLPTFIDNGAGIIQMMSADKYAVLGSPIAHSKSPVIHRAILDHLGLDNEYLKLEVTDLQKFIKSHDEFLGLSLTMPLKVQALTVATKVSDLALEAAAANTLYWFEGVWCAENTDIFGLQQAAAQLQPKSVGVLGTGATARSAVMAFRKSPLKLWGRRSEAAVPLAENFEAELASPQEVLSCDLVISTLPPGALSEILVEQPSFSGTLLDVAYSNKPWVEHYRDSISGLDMLIWQAVGQQRIFNGEGLETPLPDEAKLVETIRATLGMTK